MIVLTRSTWVPLLLTAALVLCHALTATAQVNVNNIIYTFKTKDRPVQNIIVTNSSSNPVFVAVKVEAMVDYSKKEIVTAPSDDILVSPKQFSIEANGQRTVRMLLKKPSSETERGYRVYFIPQENEFGAATVTRSEQGRTAVIKIATGVGVLVFVDPVQPNVSFTYRRDERGITFTNSGNLQVYLGDGKSCPPGVPFPNISTTEESSVGRDARHPDANGCYSLPSKRVYPGNSFFVEVAKERGVQYLKREGSAGEYATYDVPTK